MHTKYHSCLCASTLVCVYLSWGKPPEQPGSSAAPTPDTPSTQPVHADPRVLALDRLYSTVTDDPIRDLPLESVVNFIAERAGVSIDGMWTSEQNPIGLDKAARITLGVRPRTCMSLLEEVLEQDNAAPESEMGCTWQFRRDGSAMQIGPRERLNKFKFLRHYPVLHLTTPILYHGGFGGQSADNSFEGSYYPSEEFHRKRANQIIRVISMVVEPEQWKENGGESVIAWREDQFMIVAPDYIHRQIGGYDRIEPDPTINTPMPRADVQPVPTTPAAPANPPVTKPSGL